MVNHSISGQSLVNSLVALAILGIISTTFMTMQANQHKEIKALEQRMEAMALKSFLINVVGDGQVCQFELSKLATPPVLNLSSPSARANAVISFNQIRVKPSATAPNAVQVNATASGSGTDLRALKVSSIALKNFDGSGGAYKADWVISFDTGNLINPIKNISIPVAIVANDSNPSAAVVTNCGASNGGSIPQTTTGTNPTCAPGKTTILRKWTTPSCSNYGGTCGLYQGWSGAPPSCESCVNWEKCHICYSTTWDAVQCL